MLGTFLEVLCDALIAAIAVRAILSWFTNDPRNPLISALDQVTEPILAPLRRVMPRMGTLDFTPLVAILILIAVRSLVRSYYGG
jgi:YggT family protein